MADDVTVSFGANIEHLTASMAQIREVLQGLTSPLRAVRDNLGEVAEAFIAAFAVEKIKEFVEAMAELGNETEDTAAILGVATERIGELQAIAKGSGDSLQSIAGGMEKLAMNMERAQAGGQGQQDAFRRLGVSLRDTSGNMKSVDEVLNEMADSFSKHADGAEKVALAMELMGRSGARLIPILDQGREGFGRWEDMAKRTGTALSETTVKGMVEVQGALVEVGLAFQGIGVAIFNAFQPAILAIVKTVAQLVEHFSSWITESYTTGGAMRYLALMVDVVVSAIMTLVAAFELLWDIGSGIVSSLGIAMGALGKEISYALAGNFDAALQEGTNAKNALVKTWSTVGDSMGKVLTDYKDNIKQMWDATLNPPAQVTVPYSNGGKSAFGAPTDFAADKAKLDQLKQTLKEVQSSFQSVFSGIIGGFDKALSGLLNGTMDWKQAMFSVLDSLWSMFAKMIEDWVAKWLAGEATMLVAHQSAAATKVATDQLAQDQGAATMIANAVKAIFVSSKQTFAGTFANLSPTLGPAAAIPAGAAAAAVAGAASFDIGAWELPSDQVANVHKGEMIVPARGGVADAMRNALSGGGGGGDGHTFNFYGPVLDKAGLARMVAQTLSANPSMRPAY